MLKKDNMRVTHMTPIRINYTSPAIYKSDHITFPILLMDIIILGYIMKTEDT